MDCWMGAIRLHNADSMMKPKSTERAGTRPLTQRKNLNRGFMSLDVWQRAMDLFVLVYELAQQIPDFKLRSQLADAAQSVSSNIAEGYGRRSLPEYIQYLYIAKGSLAETLTRAIGATKVRLIDEQQFEFFDALHYEVENKLLNLIKALETKGAASNWQTHLPNEQPQIRNNAPSAASVPTNPIIQPSPNPRSSRR
jgi:four helix bundle protein